MSALSEEEIRACLELEQTNESAEYFSDSDDSVHDPELEASDEDNVSVNTDYSDTISGNEDIPVQNDRNELFFEKTCRNGVKIRHQRPRLRLVTL